MSDPIIYFHYCAWKKNPDIEHVLLINFSPYFVFHKSVYTGEPICNPKTFTPAFAGTTKDHSRVRTAAPTLFNRTYATMFTTFRPAFRGAIDRARFPRK